MNLVHACSTGMASPSPGHTGALHFGIRQSLNVVSASYCLLKLSASSQDKLEPIVQSEYTADMIASISDAVSDLGAKECSRWSGDPI